ncbi:unnamed protein product [Amoebophrya sp. A25]|nr:unnamed protein product [Amoebophrya sp. A25]|eukprot:GSA25T00005119001.1
MIVAEANVEQRVTTSTVRLNGAFFAETPAGENVDPSEDASRKSILIRLAQVHKTSTTGGITWGEGSAAASSGVQGACGNKSVPARRQDSADTLSLSCATAVAAQAGSEAANDTGSSGDASVLLGSGDEASQELSHNSFASPSSASSCAAPRLAVQKQLDITTLEQPGTTLLRVGRQADNDLMVPDARVSSIHFMLKVSRKNNDIVLVDSSTNGTWLNGDQVLAEAVPLRAGDLITVLKGSAVSVCEEISFEFFRSDDELNGVCDSGENTVGHENAFDALDTTKDHIAEEPSDAGVVAVSSRSSSRQDTPTPRRSRLSRSQPIRLPSTAGDACSADGSFRERQLRRLRRLHRYEFSTPSRTANKTGRTSTTGTSAYVPHDDDSGTQRKSTSASSSAVINGQGYNSSCEMGRFDEGTGQQGNDDEQKFSVETSTAASSLPAVPAVFSMRLSNGTASASAVQSGEIEADSPGGGGASELTKRGESAERALTSGEQTAGGGQSHAEISRDGGGGPACRGSSIAPPPDDDVDPEQDGSRASAPATSVPETGRTEDQEDCTAAMQTEEAASGPHEEKTKQGAMIRKPENMEEKSTRLKLRDELLQDISCGICADVLHKPVCLVPCLHNYCKACYIEWVHTSVVMARSISCPKEVCPLCRAEVTHRQPNCPLLGIIDTFLKNHPENARRDLDELDRKEAELSRTKEWLQRFPPNTPGRRRPRGLLSTVFSAAFPSGREAVRAVPSSGGPSVTTTTPPGGLAEGGSVTGGGRTSNSGTAARGTGAGRVSRSAAAGGAISHRENQSPGRTRGGVAGDSSANRRGVQQEPYAGRSAVGARPAQAEVPMVGGSASGSAACVLM